jgi:hypothetical protein
LKIKIFLKCFLISTKSTKINKWIPLWDFDYFDFFWFFYKLKTVEPNIVSLTWGFERSATNFWLNTYSSGTQSNSYHWNPCNLVSHIIRFVLVCFELQGKIFSTEYRSSHHHSNLPQSWDESIHSWFYLWGVFIWMNSNS